MSLPIKEVIEYSSIGIHNGFVYQSDISDSNINMNNRKIIMLADPVYDQDAVNLRTLISHSSDIVYIDITLNGINPTLISSVNRGAFNISVYGLENNMPCGTFSISKSSINDNMEASRLTSSGGLIDHTRLSIIWPSNTGLLLIKDTLSYDGLYRIRII